MAAGSLLLITSGYSSAAAHNSSSPSHVILARRRAPQALSFPLVSPASVVVHHTSALGRRQPETRRGEGHLARAGPPSTATLVFAFAFPLSLVIGTVLASIRIADQLDEKFLKELSENKAMMEEIDNGSEDMLAENIEGEVPMSEPRFSVTLQATSETPRSRNRPKKEA